MHFPQRTLDKFVVTSMAHTALHVNTEESVVLVLQASGLAHSTMRQALPQQARGLGVCTDAACLAGALRRTLEPPLPNP